MATYTTEEDWHTLPDSHKVYTKTWLPVNPPAALLLFIHGFSDHINSYYTFFPTLARRSIQTYAFDQRGWGRSVQNPAQRGLTGPTSVVLDDITSIIKHVLQMAKASKAPLFLMGHSMGGAEVLQYAARGPSEIRSQIRGYIVESPYLALHPSSQPSWFTVVAGRLAARVVPKRQMVQRLEPNWLCRDPVVCKEWSEDALCHDTGTLEGLAGMLDRGAGLDQDAVVVRDGEGEGGVTRLFVGHGTEDRVTSFETSKRWFARLNVKDKEFKEYEGWYHKLHAEPGEDKITFASDVADWILARATPETRSSTPEVKSKL